MFSLLVIMWSFYTLGTSRFFLENDLAEDVSSSSSFSSSPLSFSSSFSTTLSPSLKLSPSSEGPDNAVNRGVREKLVKFKERNTLWTSKRNESFSLRRSNKMSQADILEELFLSTGGRKTWKADCFDATFVLKRNFTCSRGPPECCWFISYDRDKCCNGQGFVEQLLLYQCGLVGNIPSSLAGLVNLTCLRLDGNNLFGPLPEALKGLPLLVDLDLSGNELSGSISPLSCQVRKFVADKNCFHGDITFMCDSPSLEIITISHNLLNGTLALLSVASNLSTVDFSYNFLRSVPNFPRSIVEIQMRSNGISGVIPLMQLQELPLLMRLDLSHNKLLLPGDLKGQMIPWPRLMRLMLNSNKIRNPIRQIFSISKHLLSHSMFEVNLADNSISGNFPENFVQIQQIVKDIGLIILNLGLPFVLLRWFVFLYFY
jgi:hypothetical protein